MQLEMQQITDPTGPVMKMDQMEGIVKMKVIEMEDQLDVESVIVLYYYMMIRKVVNADVVFVLVIMEIDQIIIMKITDTVMVDRITMIKVLIQMKKNAITVVMRMITIMEMLVTDMLIMMQ
ncbi:MAG: hypothetical protein EZS28_038161 [Streblomastix strix]|uniref:Uncharacterized protein n=1 Tax=Streblomastix strix TaxID=222440 RepID=A0A5J4U8S7_9EUKA|nr:MAG: hypothetical protein EZS28_038161 [Streblomastix strix]